MGIYRPRGLPVSDKGIGREERYGGVEGWKKMW